MKRVLIIINNLGVGGAERLVVDTANELARRDGVMCCLITLKKEGAHSLSDELNNDVLCDHVYFSGLFDLRSWVLVYQKIKTFEPHILYTHLWFSNTIGRITGIAARVKKIVSFEHNIYDNVKTYKMFIVDWVLQICSDRIIAVSESVKRSLIRHYISQNKIDVILNGIDESRYHNLNITEIDGVSKNDFIFLFIGRLIYQKGVDVLLKAFASLKFGTLLIIGQGQDRENLVSLSKELGIADRVKFLGVRRDIPEILSYADCFILPSRYEGLGMVVLEAMISGKVIILSDFEAGLEIIKDGYNGFIFPKEDSAALAEKMLESMTFDAELFRVRNKEIIKKFSISTYVDKLMHI